MNYLLDSNIVSYILKKNAIVDNKLREVNIQGRMVFISCITYYEIKRGLLSINAVKQLSEFHIFFQKYQTLFLDDLEIIEKSCEIHAKLKAKGTPIQDADVLIAATAIVRDLILVSNDSDLLRIEELKLENWL
ncbi:MAG: type II toxin-antitoxin system VapC family toxin [Dolichospermum sp.]|uniref:type II toxin-antitoxin system VapC family toxin n=1 Tax=Dolichospermum TaxID=748770 RepID=UPI00041F89E4|nr:MULTISPECIES: type II toxin-antitoxin system VapC family toxin [Dolichospermum]MCE2718479.1 type II toxin-antitoxin system VapC family toxin [Anabaena sp. 49628_E55]MDB9483856.1 type II toxin-antitoxin system VapC family toxin [Dolichospermum circinale CS-537/05]MCW9679956.1 type II toxin-antitoxin system VapC family toxin [Dolichospermum planctonicum UHCC 0167]MDB9476214.1 type II toxin-antitoxin system VapC family toxin [Dolichospermum circinale CS-537/11]MDB9479362.1 type II toxin-antito